LAFSLDYKTTDMITFFIAIFLIYLLFTAYLYWNQRKLLYVPNSTVFTPAEAGVPEMQIVTLHTADGLKLQAWYHEPLAPERPTIIYFEKLKTLPQLQELNLKGMTNSNITKEDLLNIQDSLPNSKVIY
jgi:hypothetical protein